MQEERRYEAKMIFKTFISHYSTLIMLVIIFSLSQIRFAHDGNWKVISPCPYLDP